MRCCGFLTIVLLFAANLSSLASAIPILHETPSLELRRSLNITTRSTSPVPIGTVLTHCVVPGVVALTFDDGPYIYTPEILESLSQHSARATFFLNGVNKGSIDGFPEIVRRAHAEGHQLGSHTWSHDFLNALDYPSIVSQMTTLEDAFLRILGVYPTYMRIPYFAFNGVVLAAMTDLGYHVIGASVDTKDYENDDPELSYRSFEKFCTELDAGGNVVLAHDTHQTTARVLCLGDPREFWYRDGR
ncbi:hypothetical protein N7468_009968 [Penicillium chermesinum]|uniref:NodB homology domain-containing protein n=1 Tax=Penicillium chermesinum TaxID=63820 RepID=A0A9W9NBS5_9EURO|nr:uncharacterized protein N7468_009968 [Penicillium chermesinum]KAJ5216960.1 hypothetical protein N7468_009968 [Penicillium chermesinum]